MQFQAEKRKHFLGRQFVKGGRKFVKGGRKLQVSVVRQEVVSSCGESKSSVFVQ